MFETQKRNLPTMPGLKTSVSRLHFTAPLRDIGNDEPEEMDIETFANSVLKQNQKSNTVTNTSTKTSLLPTFKPPGCDFQTKKRADFPKLIPISTKMMEAKLLSDTLPNLLVRGLTERMKPATQEPQPSSILETQMETSKPHEVTEESSQTINAEPSPPEPQKPVSSAAPNVADTNDIDLYNEQLLWNLELNILTTQSSLEQPLWMSTDIVCEVTPPDQCNKMNELTDSVIVDWFLKADSSKLRPHYHITANTKLMEKVCNLLQDYDKSLVELKKPTSSVTCNKKKMTLFPPSFSLPTNSSKQKNKSSKNRSMKTPSSEVKTPKLSPSQVDVSPGENNSLCHHEGLQEAEHSHVLQAVVLGPSNSGKSSFTGLLSYLRGSVSAADYDKVCWKLEKYRSQLQTSKSYKHDIKRRLLGLVAGDKHWGQLTSLAWIVDQLQEERDHGKTWENCYQPISTNKWRINVVDTPSQEDRLSERVSALTGAQMAFIVINVSHCSTSSPEDIHLVSHTHHNMENSLMNQICTAYALGVRHFILILLSSNEEDLPSSHSEDLLLWEKWMRNFLTESTMIWTPHHVLPVDISVRTFWIGNVWKLESSLLNGNRANLSQRIDPLISYLDAQTPESLRTAVKSATMTPNSPLFLVQDVFKPFNCSGWCVAGRLLSGSISLSNGTVQSPHLYCVDSSSSTDMSGMLVRGMCAPKHLVEDSRYCEERRAGASNLVEGYETISHAEAGEHVCLNVIVNTDQSSVSNLSSSRQGQQPLSLDCSLSERPLLLTTHPEHFLNPSPTGKSPPCISITLTQVFCVNSCHVDVEWVSLCCGELVWIHYLSCVVPAFVKRISLATTSGTRCRRRLVCGPDSGNNEVTITCRIPSSTSLPIFRLKEDVIDQLELNKVIVTNRKGCIIAAGRMAPN